MTTTGLLPLSTEDQGIVLSSGAGRLLFALLLSEPGVSPLTLATIAGIPRKLLHDSIQELLANVEQSPDLESAVDALTPIGVGANQSIAHWSDKKPALEPKYLQPTTDFSPEDQVEAACIAADQAGDTKAQALAVIAAWRLFFPKLAYAEEIIRRQDLAPRKAKEWINLVGAAFPGREATTVFGWLGGVDEDKLLSMQFPLAWVNKMILNKSQEAKKEPQEPESDGEEEVMDRMRQYMRNQIEQGGTSVNGNQNSEGHLLRIAQAVQRSAEEP